MISFLLPLFILSLSASDLSERFTLAEKLENNGHVHEASQLLTDLSNECEELQKDKSLLFFCAIIEAKKVEEAPSFFKIKHLNKVSLYFERAKKSVHSLPEKLYAEARVFSELPPGYGKDLKKVHIAIESLKRLKPELEISDKATIKKRFGFFPHLQFSQALGFGIGIDYLDEALQDKKRTIQTGLFGSTRENYLLRLKFSDYETSSVVGFSVEGKASYQRKDYFGIGANSSKSQLQSLRWQTSFLSFLVAYPVNKVFEVSTGWKMNQAKLYNSNLETNVFYTGPLASLKFEEGNQKIKANFALLRKEVGSEYSVIQFESEAKSKINIGRHYYFKNSLSYSFLSGDTPLSAYYLNEESALPGTRQYRFMDKDRLFAFTELSRKINSILTLAIYANAGHFSGDSKIWKGNWLLGFGGSVALRFSNYEENQIRLELGSFANEFIFNIKASVF